MRVEHEYERREALQYLAAYDVHHARVIGRLEPRTGITPFARLVEQVMTTEPYAGADRVFWIVDNGSAHRGRASVKRMRKAWPTAQLVEVSLRDAAQAGRSPHAHHQPQWSPIFRLMHLPVHASWLDQVEIFFSILQRKVLTPNDLTDLDALAERILAFQDRYNATATLRHPVRLEVHPHRPRPAPRPHRRPRSHRSRPEHGVGRRLMTPTRTSGADH